MPELRLFFEKAGTGKWLSHLDVMHTLARAFLRAGVPLRHSEGFNPHPYLSIAHPLPVGVAGLREVLDFETVSHGPEGLKEKLNAVLPTGLRVLEVEAPVETPKKIAFALYRLEFLYDEETPATAALDDLFHRDPIPVTKRTKKGESEINLHAAYTFFGVQERRETGVGQPGSILCETVVDASQAPINPKYFAQALEGTPLSASELRATRLGFLNMEGKRFE